MPLSPFEPYLDLLERSLRSFSAAERAEWREEARQHLQDIALAGEEAGLTPREAREQAIRLFGDADRIGSDMAQAMRPTGRIGTAAALFSAPLITAMLMLIMLAYAYVDTDSPALFRALQVSGVLTFLVTPVLGGWRAGKCLRPGAALLPTAAGLGLVLLFTLPVAAVTLVPALGVSLPSAALDMHWGLLWLMLAVGSFEWSRRRRYAMA